MKSEQQPQRFLIPFKFFFCFFLSFSLYLYHYQSIRLSIFVSFKIKFIQQLFHYKKSISNHWMLFLI
jgi:hypothetical protein